MEREYYSLPEAAALLGVSRIAVFKRVKKGQLPAIRFGRNWAVPASALAGLAAAAVTGPARPASPPSPRPAPAAPPAPPVAPRPEKKEAGPSAPPPFDNLDDSLL